jgi:hypothetical protein
MEQQEKRGGVRVGAGRPPRGYDVVLINFEIPVTLREKLKKKYPTGLNAKMKAFLESLV